MDEFYNNETILAIEETNEMLENQCDTKTYNSFEEVLNKILKLRKSKCKQFVNFALRLL